MGRRVYMGLLLAGCVTARPDATGSGDDRIEGAQRTEATEERPAKCDDKPGALVLLDAKSAGPVSCTMVTVQTDCASPCEPEVLFHGLSSQRGQVALSTKGQRGRVVVVVEDYGLGYVELPAEGGSQPAEVELPPSEGFWLKVLDADGNYLSSLTVSFVQGDEVLGAFKTNELANIFFASRTPFAGEPVKVQARGFKEKVIGSAKDLGTDGRTLVLDR